MLSKEEIEKAKENFNFFNESDYVTKEMVNSKEIMFEYMKQLETDKQKLIEKLEEDISKFNTYKNMHQLSKEGVGAMNYAQEILKILKGEN